MSRPLLAYSDSESVVTVVAGLRTMYKCAAERLIDRFLHRTARFIGRAVLEESALDSVVCLVKFIRNDEWM